MIARRVWAWLTGESDRASVLTSRALQDEAIERAFEERSGYRLTQPGDGRHRQHPRLCTCPQCRVQRAEKARQGRLLAQANREAAAVRAARPHVVQMRKQC